MSFYFASPPLILFHPAFKSFLSKWDQLQNQFCKGETVFGIKAKVHDLATHIHCNNWRHPAL